MKFSVFHRTTASQSDGAAPSQNGAVQNNVAPNGVAPNSIAPSDDLQSTRAVYAYLKQLCRSDNALVRDGSVLMLAIAHDVLRNIDIEAPPEHPADYE